MKHQLFNFHGQQVRTVTINDEPFFVGKDVAMILGYLRTADAIRKHVDETDKGVAKMETPGGMQNLQIINESGLYSLILGSKLSTAKEFKHWVTSEVLPAIRKHGAYMTPEKIEEALLNPDTIINLATQLKQERQQRQQLQAENDQMKPKAVFADAVTTSKSSILVGQLAKILKQNGVEIGQNRLFAWMREHGYLGKRGSNRNVPTQRAMALGLFKTKETAITHSDGHTTVQITTKVTGKGQQYFINKFLGRMISVEC
ncbi:phage antirepressor [Limosilactobacillus pontis]|uniref:phage antirepressor n=1 Tax=Limosilactobacillus pontis TaxID=35787 RepID=UPI00241DE694|nr:phage antirepressor [Limosilactobacillus pontis]